MLLEDSWSIGTGIHRKGEAGGGKNSDWLDQMEPQEKLDLYAEMQAWLKFDVEFTNDFLNYDLTAINIVMDLFDHLLDLNLDAELSLHHELGQLWGLQMFLEAKQNGKKRREM